MKSIGVLLLAISCWGCCSSAVYSGEKIIPTGAVEGVVTFVGKPPISKTADEMGHRHPLVEVDRRTKGVRYVVVYMTPVEKPQPKQGPGKENKNDKPAIVDQKEHIFTPHLIAIRSGSKVKFTNTDPANHNVRGTSLQPKNNFNVFTGAGGDYQHQFFVDRKYRPVLLSCDIHPWMRGWIFVFDHPHFAVTDKRGKFNITDLPPGRYELVVRQPDVGFISRNEVEIVAKKTQQFLIKIDRKKLKVD